MGRGEITYVCSDEEENENDKKNRNYKDIYKQ